LHRDIKKGEQKLTQDNLPSQERVNPENNDKKRKSSKKKIILIIMLVIVVIAGAAGISYAQKMKHFRNDGPLFFMMERISKELNLDDKQKADLQKIRDEIKTKMESKKQDRQKDMTDFENLFKQNSISKDELKQLVQKRDLEREEMRDFYMDEFIKFHALLTPEQRQKAIDKMHEMKDKKHKSNHEDKLPPNN
jgi:periplasmic protein CpxP/Spy